MIVIAQRSHRSEKGQSLAEVALAMPVLILLLLGMTLAGLYAFRASAADWGVFITGVAGGAFETPATAQVRPSIMWGAIRDGIATGERLDERQVRSHIEISTSHPWVFGINLVEAQRGAAHFRLWRFYPGPPAPGGVE